MKITFELSASEVKGSITNGTLEGFLSNASPDTKPKKEYTKPTIEEKEPWTNPTVTPIPAAPATFNPTVTAPVAPVPTAPIAPLAPVPAAPIAPLAPVPTAPIAPVPAAPIAPSAPVPAAPIAPVPAAPIAPGQPTIDQVRAQIAPLVKAGKIPQMQALFAEFGAQKLTDIDPAYYPQLIAKAAAL